LVNAQLGAFVAETFLYGASCVLFVLAMYFIRRRTNSKNLNAKPFSKPVFAGLVLVFVLNSSHWITDVVRLYRAFIFGVTNPGPLAYYSHLSDFTEVFKTGVLIADMVVTDCVMVYRMYIVWVRNKYVMVFAVLSVIGTIICGFGITYELAIVKIGQNIFATACGRWITSSLAMSLVTNLYSTSMIAFKIWYTQKSVKGGHLTHVLMIVVESAAMYTACSFSTLIAYSVGSNFQYPSLDMIVPTSGIVLFLIVVRVCIAQQDGTDVTPPFANESSRSQPSRGPGPGYAMRPLAVNITREMYGESATIVDNGIKQSDEESVHQYKKYPV